MRGLNKGERLEAYNGRRPYLIMIMGDGRHTSSVVFKEEGKV